MTHLKTDTLSLSLIASDDKTYQITTEDKVKDLTASIRDVGLINSPILETDDSRFKIVSGFRRVSACRLMGFEKIDVRIVSGDTKPVDYAKIAICDNLSQRSLNVIETARSIRLIEKYLEDKDELKTVLYNMGLAFGPEYIEKLKTVLNLAWPIQEGILNNSISMAMAFELGKLPDHPGKKLVSLFTELKLSLNKQREILTLLREISIREDLEISNIIEGDEFRLIFEDNELKNQQKTQNLRAYLKKRRYPRIFDAEEAFKKKVKELKLGEKQSLLPPRNFEGTSYTLSIFFKNINELKVQRDKINELINRKVLKDILEKRF